VALGFLILVPVECPWRYSSGTKMAEMSLYLFIAAEVPLKGLHRHSNGRSNKALHSPAYPSSICDIIKSYYPLEVPKWLLTI
jgi:hypothetical protein